MMHTKKNSSPQKIETPPTVTLNTDGRLEESTVGLPGAITLSTKRQHNHGNPANPDKRTHWAPASVNDMIEYSIFIAAELAARENFLEVSAEPKNDKNNQRVIKLFFPKPSSDTVPVGDKGIMVEHPQCVYGGSKNGVLVSFDPKEYQITWGDHQPVTIAQDRFPLLLKKIKSVLAD